MSGKAGHPAYFDPQDQKAYMKQAAVNASRKELIAKGNKKAPRYCPSRVPLALCPPPGSHPSQERGALSRCAVLAPYQVWKWTASRRRTEQSVLCSAACGRRGRLAQERLEVRALDLAPHISQTVRRALLLWARQRRHQRCSRKIWPRSGFT